MERGPGSQFSRNWCHQPIGITTRHFPCHTVIQIPQNKLWCVCVRIAGSVLHCHIVCVCVCVCVLCVYCHRRCEQRPSLVPYMGGGNAVTGRMVTNSSAERLPPKTGSPRGTLCCHQSAGHKPQHPGTNSAIHVLPPPSPPYAPLLSPNVLRRLDTSPGTLGGGQVQQLVSPAFPVSKWDFRILVL